MSDTSPNPTPATTMSGFSIILDGETLVFDGKLRAKEVIALESATGMTMDQWSKALQTGSMAALVALVWLLKRRVNPTIKYSDIDFALDELEIVTPEDETPEDTGVPTEAAADA